MSGNAEPYVDPLIDEVRERRRELFERHGSDLGRLYREIQRIQAEHPDKVVDPRRSSRASPVGE